MEPTPIDTNEAALYFGANSTECIVSSFFYVFIRTVFGSYFSSH